MLQKKRNEYLSVIEGIAAFSVVAIHCRFPGRFGEEIAEILGFAVPFFFAVAGFFYYNADEGKSLSNTKRKVLHLLPMVIITELFYCVWACFLYLRKYGIGVGLINSLRMVIDAQLSAYDPWALTVGFPLFEGPCWFVIQLMVAYIVFFIFLKSGKKELLYVLTPISIAFGTLLPLVIYQKSGFYPAWYIDKWTVFCSIPYFTLGYWMHENENIVSKIRVSNWLLLFLGVALVKTELELWLDIGLCMGHSFIVFSLLRMSIQNQNKIISGKLMHFLNVVGEKYSLFIYLFHTWVFSTFDSILLLIFPSISANALWGWVRPIVACITSTMFAMACYYFRNLIRICLGKNADLSNR